MDCSPQGSSVHGILQARILEWVAISPQNYQVSIHGIYECYLKRAKRFIIKWGDYPRLFGLVPKYNHRYSYNREIERHFTQKAQGGVAMETVTWKDDAAGFEVGRRGGEPRNATNPVALLTYISSLRFCFLQFFHQSIHFPELFFCIKSFLKNNNACLFLFFLINLFWFMSVYGKNHYNIVK